MSPKIQLEPQYLQIVKVILKQIIPTRPVVVFGSRTTNVFKTHSDLDLCVMGDQALSLTQYAQLKEAFSESDLPMRVDIIDWATITPEFQKIVQKHSIKVC